MRKYKFPIFILLAVASIFMFVIGFLSSTWANNEKMTHLSISVAYYLALGIIYILAFPSIFIVQILCFFRIKYSLIWVYYEKINSWKVFNGYNIFNEDSLLFPSIPLIIMLIGFIQYFDILRRITEIEKYEMGFKTWKS